MVEAPQCLCLIMQLQTRLDFLHLGDKWSTRFPFRENVQNPWNISLESPMSWKNGLKVTRTDERVSHHMQSIREALNSYWLKEVHRPAPSEASGDLLKMQNVKSDISYQSLGVFHVILRTFMFKKHCSYSLFQQVQIIFLKMFTWCLHWKLPILLTAIYANLT